MYSGYDHCDRSRKLEIERHTIRWKRIFKWANRKN